MKRAIWPALVASILAAGGSRAADSFAVSIRIDAAKTHGELKSIWQFFGADEPNYAYMKHGKTLLTQLGELRPRQVFFRAHNLLNSGDGTPALKWGSTGVYRQDADGNPVYDWTILDRIFDTYLQCGVRPYAQIGFMPKDLSTNPDPYQHRWTPQAHYEDIYTGWAYPPKDYDKWAELVYRWVQHCVERYGRQEVETWYWQVWNEPNIGYWRGTPQEFYRLHDCAIDAVRRALPSAKVGGPDTAGSGGRFTRQFFEHCLRGKNYATGETGTPLDFVSFHAKGTPTYVDGHVAHGNRQSVARNRLCIMVWHYHDDDVPGPRADVELALIGLPVRASKAILEHYRIDQDHSNAFSVWQRMGSPQSPTALEYDQLLMAGKLMALREPAEIGIQDSQAKLSFSLPRQAVSLLVLVWPE